MMKEGPRLKLEGIVTYRPAPLAGLSWIDVALKTIDRMLLGNPQAATGVFANLSAHSTEQKVHRQDVVICQSIKGRIQL